jgi:hypothetical protein
MDKDKKNRSGSQSNESAKRETTDRGRTELKGAPSKSNRQTGGNDRRERDNSSGRREENQDTKRGPNSI